MNRGLIPTFFAALTILIQAGMPAEGLIFSDVNFNADPPTANFVNSYVGWDIFAQAGFLGQSTVIANVEAGQVWYGHEVFVNAPTLAPLRLSYGNSASTDEIDYHATTVGHVLVGSGYTEGTQNFSNVGLGMAPGAGLVSAAIATSFSSENFGAFEVSDASMIGAYKPMFEGIMSGDELVKPDVINSSWGGGDVSASSNASLILDGLARQNARVAFVVAAGNGGNEAVGAPASGFNNVSVGSLGGSGFLNPSGFSSQGMSDFFIPDESGGVTISNARVAVDIAAPGESLFLAAYLGDSGTIGASPELAGIIQEPSPTDLYFTSLDGTSYSAPIVAGGIALLKDVAKRDPFLNHNGNPEAFDTRVVKSVIMAGARETNGWDNGQNEFNVTTQALDLQTGAGALDLEAAADVYFFGTRDVDFADGNTILEGGWDAGTVNLSQQVDYVFGQPFSEEMTLTVALNWFSVREFDELNGSGSDLAFSNLDLQVWLLAGGVFDVMVGESMTTYNNSEFLRLDGLAAGQYGLRVVFKDMVFDTTSLVDQEFYGLAWQAVAIPEPRFAMLLSFGITFLLTKRRRGKT
jgi:hypothetical protein